MDPLAPQPAQGAKSVETLIRDAKIAGMRGDAKQELALIEEALILAPKSPGVLEAKGDALLKAGKRAEAEAAYQAGLDLAPGHNTLEAKYAELVLGKVALDPDLVLSNDVGTFANGKIAALISVVIPGLGHIILGQTVKGIAFMGGFILATVLCVLLGGVSAFLSLFRNFQEMSGMGLFVLGATVLFYVIIQFDVAALAKRMVPPKISRPIPPVDKPF